MILLTGASGFIGKSLASKLGNHVRCVIRSYGDNIPPDSEVFYIDSISPETIWSGAFIGIDVIIHLAGRAHVLDDATEHSLNNFKFINTYGTIRLASEAAKNGVKRFVFLSSIGVNGDHSLKPFCEADDPSPASPYAISKLEAEEGLRKISKETGMEVVIIRPPLVYGPNAPGNFTRLLCMVHKGIPLPFSNIKNKRSFISLDNLVDFILLCASHPKAANETFLISDGEDISTYDLIYLLAKTMNKPCYSFPLPFFLIIKVAEIFNKKREAIKLLASLQIDSSKANRIVDWVPPVDIREALRQTVIHFLKNQSKK